MSDELDNIIGSLSSKKTDEFLEKFIGARHDEQSLVDSDLIIQGSIVAVDEFAKRTDFKKEEEKYLKET